MAAAKETVDLTITPEFRRIVHDTTKAVYEAGRRSASGGLDGLDASETVVTRALERVLLLQQSQGLLRTPDIVYVVKPTLNKPEPIQEEKD